MRLQSSLEPTNSKTLIVITGATASGKTSLAIEAAEHIGCDIISADSRQIYRGMPIGTAAPTEAELARVKHHLVGILRPDEYYSAARFEADALALLGQQWLRTDVAIVCGGSMMYVDALTDGIDELPTISDGVRTHVASVAESGPEALLALLEIVDSAYAAEVDRANLRRVAHAIEISLQAGRPYSEMRGGERPERPFRIVKVAIDMPRPRLFERINARVEAMVDAGLAEEARTLLPLRHLNALNTVGYKEMFAYFDGTFTLRQAIDRIAKNTRVYAKKQLTWLARPSVRPTIMLDPSNPLKHLLSLI